MATNPYGGASALPLTLLVQAIPMLSRHDLESLAERLIDRLDEIDPDPDAEEDDPAGQFDEDGINTSIGVFWMHGTMRNAAGCSMSEPGI